MTAQDMPATSTDTRITCGDCMDILPTMPDGSVDLILTDPPYSTTNLKFDQGFDIGRVLPEFRRVLKPSGWFFCFASFELAATIYGAGGWKYRFAYVWVKSKPTTQHGSVKRPRHSYEKAYVFVKPELKVADLYFDKKALRTDGSPYKEKYTRRETEFQRSQSHQTRYLVSNSGYREGIDVLLFPNKTAMRLSEQTIHPTQKPLGLMKLLISGYCPPDGLVLDPFAGSGTTAVAAKMTGRRCIAVKIDDRYYAIARHRLGLPVSPDHAISLRVPGQEGLV